MRSAQSRLGVVTSFGAACRGVGRCVEALPVPSRALRIGAASFAGLAGALMLRLLMPSRRKPAAAATTTLPATAEPRRNVGRYLLSETMLTLLLPLCRRYLLGDAALPASGGVLDNLLRGSQKSVR